MSLTSPEKIGIMGGGINAALLCLEAKKKGIQTTIVDEDMYCPASKVADEHLVAPLNKSTLFKLIQRTDAIVFTKKLENPEDYIPLLKEKTLAYPQVEILETLSTRQKFLWKMEQKGIPIVNYKRLDSEVEMLELLKEIELPISITKHYKSQTKNNQSDEIVLLSDEDIVDLLMEKDKQVDYWLIEEMHLEAMELSVGVTRDIKNKLYTYSVSEDIYDGDDWIQSHVPARISKTLQNKAIALAKRAVKSLEGVGTFTVNISLNQDKEFYVRDIHPYALANSVYTNESCNISQTDHLIRTILGLPLYPAIFDGVLFTHLEKGTLLSDVEKTSALLARQETNVYSFRGKVSEDTMLLYTFKAETWGRLEDNLKI
ncbi:MAG TPA: ATP-grasp domain-containing protein [Epulopiscium sp.]|nr:ATP-grasp domain-containing protein [Candidatus Epulonipiscium sp.]